MYRATTPYHKFKLPVEKDLISKLYITYAQEGKILFEKDINDCTFVDSNTKVQIKLTQEETLLCRSDKYKVEVQMTILTTNNDRITSNIKALSAGRILKEEVI